MCVLDGGGVNIERVCGQYLHAYRPIHQKNKNIQHQKSKGYMPDDLNCPIFLMSSNHNDFKVTQIDLYVDSCVLVKKDAHAVNRMSLSWRLRTPF